MDFEHLFDVITTETQNKIIFVENQLRDCPAGKLREEKHGGKYYFVQDDYNKGKRFKHCLTQDGEILNQLIKKRFYEDELKSLYSISSGMRTFRNEIINFSMEQTMLELQTELPHLSEERILETLYDKDPDEWASADYEKNNYKSENLKQITSRGLKVRSKSEALIAESLYQYNLAFRYEQVMHFNGLTLVPDFVIRRYDGKLFYWEHQGLTNDKKYIEHQMKKAQIYASAGIVPWDNYIVTYDNETGVDLRRIDFEIQNRLLNPAV